jgi:hypothetical protein
LWRIFTALPRVRQGIQLSIVYAMDVENTREFCKGKTKNPSNRKSGLMDFG